MSQLYKVDTLDRVEGPIDRTLAHEDVVLHRAGVVFLKRLDGDLMVRRRPPAHRTLPSPADASASFHVEFGESYLEAAQRELRTETGVATSLSYLGKFRQLDPPEHQMLAVFAGVSAAQVRTNPLQSSGWEWRSKGEVDDLVAETETTPWMRTAWRLVRDRV